MVMVDETRRELAACLEKLRWTLAGARAGGVTGWSHVPVRPPHSGVQAAEAPLTPPPPAPPARGGEEFETLPGSGVGHGNLTGSAGGEVRSEERRNAPDSGYAESAHTESGHAGEIIVERGIVDSLDEISRSLSGCSRCRLHSGRTNLVFGEGTAGTGIVFVGEGPGSDEDRQGRPFVGRAGKLLDKMIQAMGYGRSDVYICNVVKCRPPGNRTPQPEEIEACSPFLIKQITALRPKVICTLGACASQSLLASSKSISQLRGKIHFWRGIPLVCTYHPAYLLRNPIQKAATWQDLKEVLGILHSDMS